MKVHVLSCATMCPPGRRFVEGTGGWLERGRMVALCLLVEGAQGLTLVDTGLGRDDMADGGRRLPLGFRIFTTPRLDAEETAVRQVERLGFSAEDVRDIVLTHLDLDHAGGLADFPRARVHVHRTEHDAAMRRAAVKEKSRYVPRQWAHGPQWVLHEAGGDRLLGFASVRSVGEIALIPLAGHTRGHCAVAVPTPDGRWIVHGGDAFFHHGEIERRRWCPIGLRLFQGMMAMNNTERLHNAQRLWDLAQRDPTVDVVCSHAPVLLERLRTRLTETSSA